MVRFSQDGPSATKAEPGQGNFLSIKRNPGSPQPHTGMTQGDFLSIKKPQKPPNTRRREKTPGECGGKGC